MRERFFARGDGDLFVGESIPGEHARGTTYPELLVAAHGDCGDTHGREIKVFRGGTFGEL